MTNAARDFIENTLLPWCKEWGNDATMRYIKEHRYKWDKPEQGVVDESKCISKEVPFNEVFRESYGACHGITEPLGCYTCQRCQKEIAPTNNCTCSKATIGEPLKVEQAADASWTDASKTGYSREVTNELSAEGWMPTETPEPLPELPEINFDTIKVNGKKEIRLFSGNKCVAIVEPELAKWVEQFRDWAQSVNKRMG